jgi:hypothetical protein
MHPQMLFYGEKPIAQQLWTTTHIGGIYVSEEKWSLHSFLTTASQQADVASNILLCFYKKKIKQK